MLKEEAAAQGRRLLIAVAGCVAQAEGQEIIRRAGAVDLVVGSQNYHRLPDLIARVLAGGRIVDTEFPADDKFDVLAAPRTDAIRKRGIAAFVTVQEGCDKFCTFCVVPYTRGAEVSRPVEKIAVEVERLAQAGVREVTLIGQNVNAYHGQGDDGRPATLGKLLRRLARVLGIARLRYMTSHPRDMDDDLIAAHGDLPALMPYVHLPVQSGSDRILAAMNRRHTRKDYLAVIAKLRAARADLAFTSDFIVGFPGETEEDFRATLTLVDEVGFATAYSFIYSPRPGTPAAEMDAQVPADEQAERLQRLQARHHPPVARLQRAICRPHHASAAGETGQAPWAIGRPHPISAGGAGHGAARHDRFAGTGRNQRDRQQYAVRRTRRQRRVATCRSRSLRNPLRTPDPPIPAAAASEETATTQIVLAFEDNRLASILFGQYGQNLALIERRLGVVAEQRGNHVTIDGSRGGCEQARRVLEGIYEHIKRGHELAQGDVEGAIRQAIAQGSLFDYDPAGARPAFEEINLRKRPVRARTAAQDAYIRALKRHHLVFGTGPAGTGKTWLAVAQAIQMFERKEVDRIILSRPAVEAGERLGFLPGDMREKVDPYLRPIYDALYDLMDARIVERSLQAGEIEIAPLAFMRGRTLSNAAIILDEAQNTTSMQMKMFLTRLGENSRMIVTGDPSQVDLPSGQTSGLAEAVKLLDGIEGVGHVAFTHEDVIRHELVARIVEAYDRKVAREDKK